MLGDATSSLFRCASYTSAWYTVFSSGRGGGGGGAGGSSGDGGDGGGAVHWQTGEMSPQAPLPFVCLLNCTRRLYKKPGGSS